MRNLLALVGLALVAFGGLGWYLGWYKIKNSPADPGHHNVNIDINTKKIGADLHNGEEHIQKWLENGKDGKGEPAKAKDNPDKSGAVRAAPDMTGFPFDPPGAAGATTTFSSPLLQSSAEDAPVPGGYFNKKNDGPATDPLALPPGVLR